jgi:uncharacterized membrane protein YgdD (TMEM256/DUF423 family)
MSRLFLIVAGLFGASGVGLAAAAAHIGGLFLGSASQMLLVHAPVLLALGLFGAFSGPRGRALAIGGLVLLVGVVLFSGDLALRNFAGRSLFSMAAPTGGTLMMAGWIILASSSLLPQGAARSH